MEKKSLQFGDLLIAVVLPLLAVIIGTVGVIITIVTKIEDIWMPIIFMIPAVYAFFFGLLNLIFGLMKKEKAISISNIVFHSINVVANILTSIATMFIGLLASVFIAIIGGIGSAATENQEAAKEATDAQISAFMNHFTPLALVFLLLALVSVVCAVFSGISLKKKIFGVISGELTRSFYMFGGVGWLALGTMFTDGFGYAKTFTIFLCAALGFISMAHLGGIQISINQERRGFMDFIERFFLLMINFSVAVMLFYPQYLKYNSVETVAIYFNTHLDVVISIITLLAVLMLFAARYVNNKRVSLFFLTAIAMVLLASAFTLAIIFMVKDNPASLILLISTYSLGFIATSFVGVLQVVNFIKVRKAIQGV